MTSAMRTFATKPKVEDGSLEGRYVTALFMAVSDNLDKAYSDMTTLRAMMAESADFKLMVETPGIEPEAKIGAIESICSQAGMSAPVVNFLKVLVENKRMNLLAKMIDLFETFYRAEKGLIPCKVTSAKELSSYEMEEVKAAMQKRAEPGQTLIMDFATNPAILGGLQVKMGEAVFDFSVATKLERLQTQLLAPLA